MISSLYESKHHNQLPYGGEYYKPTASTAAVAAAAAAVAVAKANGQIVLGTPAFSASSLSPPGVEEFSTPLLNSSDPAVATLEWVDQTPGPAFSTEACSSILTPTTKTNLLATPKNYISTTRPLYMEKGYNTQDPFGSVTGTIPCVESTPVITGGQNNVAYYDVQGNSITNVNTNQSFGQPQANKPYVNTTIYSPVQQPINALVPAQDPNAIHLEFLNPTSPSSFQPGNLIQYSETTTTANQGSQMLLEQSIGRPLFPPLHPSLPPTGTFHTHVIPPPPHNTHSTQPYSLQPLQPFQALQPGPAAASGMANSAHVEKRYQCQICHKYFRRDLPRHMRTHQETARFTCPFPRKHCPHKRGQFNRPYDFKKHLLHGHFVFDDQKNVRAYRDLKRKLGCMGVCMCGTRFLAEAWLECHILSKDKRCALLSGDYNGSETTSASSASRPTSTTSSDSSNSSGARNLSLPNRSGQENPLPYYRPQVLNLEMRECVHENQI